MRCDAPPIPLPRLLLLGTLELGLLPLRLAARLVGGLLLAMAVIGLPAWLIQLAIRLLGGGTGGGPLPAWAMIPLLAAAAPAGVVAFRIAGIRGPLGRSEPAEADTETTYGYDAAAGWDEADADDGEAEPKGSVTSCTTEPLAWAYTALELDPRASLADIKAAYRRRAHVYHPDHNPGFTKQAAERFATITEAYEALVADRSTATA